MKSQIKIIEVQHKIGKVIEYCRKREKLTQEELAERIGSSRPTISNIENGKVANTNSILKIFKYFDILQDLDAFYESLLKRLEEEKGVKEINFYE